MTERRSIMTPRNTSLVLAAVIAALAGASAVDSASAQQQPGSSFKPFDFNLSAATGGGGHQDIVAFGEKLSAKSRASRIPQALPGSKMNRGGMGAPIMRRGMGRR
jgi:hypothetical protein